MPTFELVNPYVVGTMKKTFNVENSSEAASQAWNNLSKHVVNNVPKFAFTIKKISDNKLYHYVVKEKLGKNKEVSFSIKELKLNLSSSESSKFLSRVNQFDNSGKLTGGKKDDSSSSDSSDSSDSDSESDTDEVIRKIRHFKNRNQPLSFLYYNPVVYNKDGNLASVYIPTWNTGLSLSLNTSPFVFLNLTK
jgi:hypothetical protein